MNKAVIMNRNISAILTASALIFGVLLSGKALAQAPNELVGTWALVSISLETDGKTTTDYYGPNPMGQVMYDANGHYTQMVLRSDLQQFASGNRTAGTPEEYEAVVHGSLAQFGTYSVNDADKTLTVHVEGRTFPNWKGSQRKYRYSVSGDEFRFTTFSKASTGTGIAHLVWKRAK
jgi:hypothetical protein